MNRNSQHNMFTHFPTRQACNSTILQYKDNHANTNTYKKSKLYSQNNDLLSPYLI